jgi:hypothetical protein
MNLRDERYLPFEGHGVVESTWRIDLPKDYRAFDYTTITDAVLQLRYTAREGGERLRDAATAAIGTWIAATEGDHLTRAFDLRAEGPSGWNLPFGNSTFFENSEK